MYAQLQKSLIDYLSGAEPHEKIRAGGKGEVEYGIKLSKIEYNRENRFLKIPPKVGTLRKLGPWRLYSHFFFYAQQQLASLSCTRFAIIVVLVPITLTVAEPRHYLSVFFLGEAIGFSCRADRSLGEPSLLRESSLPTYWIK